MAKLHKVEMYVVEVNDPYENIALHIDYLFDRSEAFAKCIKVVETVEFPWSDGCILNYTPATEQEIEAFVHTAKNEKEMLNKIIMENAGTAEQVIRRLIEEAGLTANEENMADFIKCLKSWNEND